MGCIVLLMSGFDASRDIFLSLSDTFDLRIMTPVNLSEAGWFYGDTDWNSDISINNEIIHEEDIDGVITRLGAVTERELPHIREEDRSYAAAEMNAFLTAWLSALNCPVRNRPTATCLSGPNLSQIEWVSLVAKMSIPVASLSEKISFHKQNNHNKQKHGISVTVIGEHSVGEADPVLHEYAKKIASLCGVDFIQVVFTHAEKTAKFVTASIWPLITRDISRLMLKSFSGCTTGNNMEKIALCV